MQEEVYSATYLELWHTMRREGSEVSHYPHNTFKLYYVDGYAGNSPEYYCEGQWVASPLVNLANAKKERENLSEEDKKLNREQQLSQFLQKRIPDKRVRLIFNQDYNVVISESVPYAKQAAFQWGGKERLQAPWHFCVTVRGDGSVCGGGRGFGVLQQSFSGTWRDGLVDLVCNYSDGSVATFQGHYSERNFPVGERFHKEHEQAYFLEMTVTVISLGPTLAKSNVVQAGAQGVGEGVYVPQYHYENVLKGGFGRGFGRNEQKALVCESDVTSFSAERYLSQRERMGPLDRTNKVALMVRLNRRRLLGSHLDIIVENPPWPLYTVGVNPLFQG